LKKVLFMTMVALGAGAFVVMAQEAAKFNGTWKGEEGGQIRKLNVKDGVVYMEETQPNGRLILRQYPINGQEITMTEGVWKDSKATGKMTGNKLVVETTMPTGMQWHDEWTIAADGKSYTAVRLLVSPGTGGGLGGAQKGPGTGAPKASAAAAKAGSGTPELFSKVE
jgi:hypothetical protein